ncbi:MAG: polysaccharide biosynthesis tyrosine autokinase [Clostridia bacterium]|nr:polysaccharide biosynthesis tyrosine autokinase [Clostridia bacterium]
MDLSNAKERPVEQVDISFLLKIFRAVFLHIIIVGLLCGGAAGAFRYFTTSPTYTSTVTFYVNAVSTRSSDGTNVITPGSTSAARDLAEAFTHVVQSGAVIQDVIENLDKKVQVVGEDGELEYVTFSGGQIKGMLNVSVDTQVLIINITHESQTVAHEVAKAFEAVVPSSLDFYVGIQNDSNDQTYQSVAKRMDSAELDTSPSGRGSTLVALLGFILGAALVYIVAFFRAFFDNTIYNEEDIKTYFTLPVIGQIPTWSNENSEDNKKKKRQKQKKGSSQDYIKAEGVSTSSRDYAGRLLSKKTPFAIAEAFKLLRTNMCYTTKGEECAVFAVTSANVGAGKSILIANIAISFAEMGKKVLLLDGDLRCPVQHRVFGLDPKTYGLSEVLAGVCKDDSRAIRPSGYENLDVVTSGRIPPNPAELLASAKFRAFMEEAKKSYDVIFIDLPPICEVTDAGVLSDMVTGYTFVIRAAYSDRRLIEFAVDTMQSLGASVIGFILNDVDIKSGDYYKNKYSGYGYGRYGKYGRYSVYSKYKYAKYAKYGKYSNYGKYGKYSKYGKYGKYAGYGRYGYQRKDGDYRYGYTDEEIDEQNLQKVDEAVDTASSANKDN